MRNKVPFILCLIGGSLMIYAGVVRSVGFWEDLINFAATIAPGLPTVTRNLDKVGYPFNECLKKD